MISREKYQQFTLRVDSFALLAAILQAIPELFRALRKHGYVPIATDEVLQPCWKVHHERVCPREDTTQGLY